MNCGLQSGSSSRQALLISADVHIMTAAEKSHIIT